MGERGERKDKVQPDVSVWQKPGGHMSLFHEVFWQKSGMKATSLTPRFDCWKTTFWGGSKQTGRVAVMLNHCQHEGHWKHLRFHLPSFVHYSSSHFLPLCTFRGATDLMTFELNKYNEEELQECLSNLLKAQSIHTLNPQRNQTRYLQEPEQQ